MISLKALEKANRKRNTVWDPDDKLTLMFFAVELGGETGEALNAVKKIEREALGLRGARTTIEHLGQELADVVICASLCAIKAGIDLEQALQTKFNATSDKLNLPVHLEYD